MGYTSESIHDEMQDLLNRTKIVAVVGWSPDPSRPSHRIASYLKRAGYDVIPVNPNVGDVDGVRAFPSLAEVPGPVDLVVIFRRPEEASAHIDEAIAKKARGVWLQEGIRVRGGEERARMAGLDYVEDRCVMVEHRLRFR